MITAGLLALTLLAAGADTTGPPELPSPSVSLESVLARADSAWSQGRDDEARIAYRTVLDLDPRSVRAQHRLALLLSRIDRLDSALVLVGRARSLEPQDAGLLASEARLLSWAGRLDESIADYDTLLTLDPHDRGARLGRARVLGWTGRYAAAESMYVSLAVDHPNDVEAILARAQNATWCGRPGFAEAQYLAAVELDGHSVEALLGLAQLRQSQGRPRAAAAPVARALALEPGSHTANSLRRQILAARRPQLDLGFALGQDSDRAAGWSRTFSASFPLADRMRGFAAGGVLDASDPVREASSLRGELGLDAGYGRAQVVAAAGTHWLDSPAGPARAAPSYRTSLSYLLWPRLTARVGFARYPMDETAVLIRSGLELSEFQTSVDAEVGHGLALSAGGGGASLSDGNHRSSGVVALTHSYGRRGSLGVLARALSYERRGLGYFSPERYVLTEARGTYAITRHAWSAQLTGGLGAQQVGAQGAAQPACRAAGQFRYGWAALNHIEASIGASNSTASSTTGAYRYLTAGIALHLGL